MDDDPSNPANASPDPGPDGADKPVPDRRVRVALGPDARYTLGAGIGAVLFALLTVVATDPAGRLLFALGALLLLVYVVTDLVFRPRLVLTADGLVVNAPTARFTCGWDEVERFEVDSRRRLGLSAQTVEIDAADRLVVFSRRALGADPVEVAEIAGGFRTSPSGR